MWTTDPARRAVWRRIWAVWLAMLGLAGAWRFAGAPAELLRGRWGTSLAWLVTLGCCGVAAEALWNGRAYRDKASHAVLWGTLLVWAPVLFRHASPVMPGVSLPVLVMLTITAFMLVVYDPPDRP